MKFYAYKQLNGSLVPCHNSDWEKAKKLKPEREYQIEIKRPRNIKFHRKFFALMNLVFDNQEQFNNLDVLRKELIIEAGYFDTYFDLHGIEQKQAKSISFASMDEDEFSELYNRVIDVIIKHFGFEKQSIIENIEQYF